MNFQHNFRTLARLVWSMVLIGTLAMLISRTVFFFNVIDWSQLPGREADVWRAFFIGSRFDIKIMTIAYAPLFLLGLLCACFDWLFRRFTSFSYYYNWLIMVLVVGFSIGNYYYYVTYGTYMDMFVFGLFDDDTKAVLINIWQDYPVVWGMIALTFLAGALNKLYGRVLARSAGWSWPKRHWIRTTAIVMITVSLYFVLARGSVGTFPLRRLHANVSDYVVLNMVTPNPFIALSWASGDYKRQATIEPISEDEYHSKLQNLLGKPEPYTQTPHSAYLAENKPDVVVALMESMGTNVLVEDKLPENDMLGALRRPFEDDFVFKRFVAETSGTIDSLVAMLFYSPVTTISHSNVQRVTLPENAIKPYKDNGYETTFIMSSNGMWRNLANYLPRQGFDRFVDVNQLIKAYPEAGSLQSVWGVPDEFAFKYAEKLLAESDKPQFIYILTVTNHPPFEVPGNYEALPVKVSQRLEKLSGPLSEQNIPLLQTYQYANNALGEFIQHIKAGEKGDRTLIAATGDHRVRYLDPNQAGDFNMTHAVPFYLYVPDSIQSQVEYVFEPERIGSHRDVFPTLYHFSLSDARFVSLGGENLLSSSGVSNIGYHFERVIDLQGGYDTRRPEVRYPWSQDGFHNESEGVESRDKEVGRNYRELQNVFFRWQVKQGLISGNQN